MAGVPGPEMWPTGSFGGPAARASSL